MINPWSLKDTDGFLSKVRTSVEDYKNTKKYDIPRDFGEYQTKYAFIPFLFHLLCSRQDADVYKLLACILDASVFPNNNKNNNLIFERDWIFLSENILALYFRFLQMPLFSGGLATIYLEPLFPKLAEYHVQRQGEQSTTFLAQLKEALRREDMYPLILSVVDSILKEVHYTQLFQLLVDSLKESFGNKLYERSDLILGSISNALLRLNTQNLNEEILKDVCQVTIKMLERNPMKPPTNVTFFHTIILGVKKSAFSPLVHGLLCKLRLPHHL